MLMRYKIFLGSLVLPFIVGLSSAHRTDTDKADSKNKVKILFVRHGRTDWNDLGKIQGHTDRPLNKKGILQAHRVAQFLLSEKECIDGVYSSDLQRAATTANHIAAVYNRRVELSVALRERDMGDAEGIHEHDFHAVYGPVAEHLKKIYPNRLERWQYSHVPNAETELAIVARVQTYLKEILHNHRGGTIVVVTHGTVIKTIITHNSERYEEVPNCSIVEFEYDAQSVTYSFKGIRTIPETE